MSKTTNKFSPKVRERAVLMQQVLEIPQRKRESDVHHHRHVNDLGARLEPLESVGLGYGETLHSLMPHFKPGLSDKAPPARRKKSSSAPLHSTEQVSLNDSLGNL